MMMMMMVLALVVSAYIYACGQVLRKSSRGTHMMMLFIVISYSHSLTLSLSLLCLSSVSLRLPLTDPPFELANQKDWYYAQITKGVRRIHLNAFPIHY